jgi:hypothetical protein
MTPLGIGPRDVLSLARHARQAEAAAAHPVLVTGILAPQLADALAAGGDRSLVRTAGDPAEAGAFVRVVAGATTPEDEAQLRAATRALVPVVVVQTGIASVRLPYVLATDIVEVPPGSGFPVEAIADAVAGALGAERAPLAARLPVLREAFERHRKLDAVVSAATLAALARGTGSHLPVLTLSQARMLTDLAAAGGAPTPGDPRAAAEAVGPRLGAAVATGLLSRSLVRRLPLRNRLVDAAVAAGSTFALATLFARIGSVRSRS